MQKVKGLISAIKGNQQVSIAILPYNKRIEQYSKIMKRINQVYNKVFIDPYFNFVGQLSALNKNMNEEMKQTKNKSEFYMLVVEAFVGIQKSIKSTNQEVKSYSDEGFKAINDQCQKIKRIVDNLHEKLKQHDIKQNQINQNVKKYSKSHKNFIQVLNSYKLAFQDVKLIYNTQQKIKRYKACSDSFETGVSQLQDINNNIDCLSGQRDQLRELFLKFRTQSIQFVRIVGQEIIKIPQNIIKCSLKLNKEIFLNLVEKSKDLKQKPLKIFLEKFRLPFPNPEYFNCQLKQQENSIYPSFLPNLKFLKTEHFVLSKKYLIEFYNSTRQDIKQRTQIIDKLRAYFTAFSTLLQKLFINQQKQIKQLINQRYMKIIQNNFSQDLKQSVDVSQSTTASSIIGDSVKTQFNICSVIESIVSFMQDQKQLSKNMNKFYVQHFKQINLQLQEELKILSTFKDDFKERFYMMFSGKKEFKKDLEYLKSGQLDILNLTQDQVKNSKDQILKKIDFVVLLVSTFADKLKTVSTKVKSSFLSFFDDYSKYYGYEKDLLQKQKSKLQKFTSILIERRLQQPQNKVQKYFWTDQNSLYSAIVKEKLKVKFDSQIDKVNEFKKLKKPTNDYDEKGRSPSPKLAQRKTSIKQNPEASKFFGKNYQLFVQQNTIFEQGQKYVSNFKCGLCDNIIISGRLYITTNRLFFHSRFNSSNIFFGQTKLQIPRFDIKKIQKKYNALIFDNSISITTVNGQIFFTSFISRDQAYDLICKTFDIDHDVYAFVEQDRVQKEIQEVEDFNLNVQQEDDMPDVDLQERARKIDQMLEIDQKSAQKAADVNYQNVSDEILNFPGLNAVKVFRIFESLQEMPYKNKTYQNFFHYFKGHVHKNQDLTIQSWEPNVLEYLNPSNIKSSTPLKFTMNLQTNVPAPQTSIPFMPKFIHSCQTHDVYFYSKDKYVIILKCKNSKAPYTDCFYLRYKKVVEKIAQNTVRIQSNLKIVFVKSTMMKGLVESKTLESSLENNKSLTDEMKKYLKYLENNMMRKKISQNDEGEDKANQGTKLNEDQQENQNKIQSLQRQNKTLKQGLESTLKQKSTIQWILLFSLVLNLIFGLLLYSGEGSTNSNLQV